MTPDELRTMCRATVSDIFDAIPVLLDQGDIDAAKEKLGKLRVIIDQMIKLAEVRP